MGGMQWVIEIVLVLMLAATLFHALRLERALGVLARDRASLEALVAEFNASSRTAQASISRLHEAADGAGRQIGRQLEGGIRLKDDLIFLLERGDTLADRLDALVRAGRQLDPPRADFSRSEPPRPDLAPPELHRAEPARPVPASQVTDPGETEPDPDTRRVRSQAERDLMKALRLTR